VIGYLRNEITNGNLAPGARLPSEAQLTEMFGISRGPVRQALGVLVNEGIIERIHGSGSYVRNHAPDARSTDADLKKKLERQQIGVVLNNPGDQLNMEILMGIERGAKLRGYQVVFTYSEESVRQQKRDIQRLRGDGLQNLLIFSIGKDAEAESLVALVNENVNLVLIDRYFRNLPTHFVVADNFNGGYRAVEHLLMLGHQRISFAYSHQASLQITSVEDRWRGYRRALEDYDLAYDESLVYQNPVPTTDDRGYEPLLRRADRPTAIFAANDYEALAAMQAAQRLKIGVPDELAVVGFDDLNFAAFLPVPLTTVAQPRLDIGFRAVNVLIDQAEGLLDGVQQIMMPTNLIVRESCGSKQHVRRTLANGNGTPHDSRPS
jgi:GntR family transcriptional regulator, arabinose operon transcriptional repressor